MRAAFFTLGCKVNQYETQILKQYFSHEGYDIVEPEEEADVYVVNSCTVTASGDKKTRQVLKRFRLQNEQAVIAVTGCMPQAFPEESAEIMDADVITGSYNRKELVSAVKQFQAEGERIISITSHEKGASFEEMEANNFEGHTRAFLKIQDGCQRYCAYCIIPKARGGLRSKPMEDIRREVEVLAEKGYREIVLVGINLSCYGVESTGSLVEVVEMIAGIEGVSRIRLGSLEPEMMTKDILTRMAQIPEFCPQFHLSMQSGSKETLRRMNRHYTPEEYTEIVENIRDIFENPAITTDIMVGFPGETDDEFEETKRFVEKIKLARAHVFAYSNRKGTRADKMTGQISKEVKTARSRTLIQLTNSSKATFLEAQVGTVADVLFEMPEGGSQRGYSKNYTRVFVDTRENLAGQQRKVRLTKVMGDGCEGELVLW